MASVAYYQTNFACSKANCSISSISVQTSLGFAAIRFPTQNRWSGPCTVHSSTTALRSIFPKLTRLECGGNEEFVISSKHCNNAAAWSRRLVNYETRVIDP